VLEMQVPRDNHVYQTEEADEQVQSMRKWESAWWYSQSRHI